MINKDYDIPQECIDVQTAPYVCGYKEQSQLHVHEINRANLSSEGRKIMQEIYKVVTSDDKPVEIEENKVKKKTK